MNLLRQPARRVAVLAMACLLLACAPGPRLAGGHDVTLGGAQDVPANTSAASGSSTLYVALDHSLTGAVRYTGMVATVAHIHAAPAGANGPVIVVLVKTGDGLFAVPADTSLTPAQYASYLAGNLYVNVHSAAYPAGEIRAQLKPDKPK